MPLNVKKRSETPFEIVSEVKRIGTLPCGRQTATYAATAERLSQLVSRTLRDFGRLTAEVGRLCCLT